MTHLPLAPEDSVPGLVHARAFGVTADPAVDNTAALQRALESVARVGGRVLLPAGRYRVDGSLRLPVGASLCGVNRHHQDPAGKQGTIICAHGGRGDADGPPLFDLRGNAAVTDLTVFYPDQRISDLKPYPWTVQMQDCDTLIDNLTLINSWAGIRIGPRGTVRPCVRNVYGTVLRFGVKADCIYDILRMEDVHFHCDHWARWEGAPHDAFFKFMAENLETFVFGRVDWAWVARTFVYPARIGYRFIRNETNVRGQNACNGQFEGIGADQVQVAVQVDALYSSGLSITNGQICPRYPNTIGVLIGPECQGTVRLSNSLFWGGFGRGVVSHNSTSTAIENCSFQPWAEDGLPGACIEADNGKLQVTGCSFISIGDPDRCAIQREITAHPPYRAVDLRPGLRHAVIVGNDGTHGVHIRNAIGDRAIIQANEPASGTLGDEVPT